MNAVCTIYKLRKLGLNRPAADPEMKNELHSRFLEHRYKKLTVFRRLLMRKAVSISKSSTFKGSEAWLFRFLKRFNISQYK